MHFDGETLYFADVGQDDWEEVNRGVKGGNYGWNVMEGMHCFKNAGCSSKDMIPPLAEYGHGEGRSVTGGVVYRGPSIPVLDGRYVYADFVTGVLWALPVGGGDAVKVADTELLVSSFGRDRRGRLYIGDYKGVVYRVDPK
jgi:glucose/arabinose dehydrogenase